MRIIIWILIFYLVYRLLKSFMRNITGGGSSSNGQNQGNSSSSHGGNYAGSNGQNAERKKYKIDKKDVVEARFEEIRDENSSKAAKEKNESENEKKPDDGTQSES